MQLFLILKTLSLVGPSLGHVTSILFTTIINNMIGLESDVLLVSWNADITCGSNHMLHIPLLWHVGHHLYRLVRLNKHVAHVNCSYDKWQHSNIAKSLLKTNLVNLSKPIAL